MEAIELDQFYIKLLDHCTNFYDNFFVDKENEEKEKYYGYGYGLYMDMCSASAIVVCDKYHYDTKKIFSLIDQYSAHPEDAKQIISDWTDTVEDSTDFVDDFIKNKK